MVELVYKVQYVNPSSDQGKFLSSLVSAWTSPKESQSSKVSGWALSKESKDGGARGWASL